MHGFLPRKPSELTVKQQTRTGVKLLSTLARLYGTIKSPPVQHCGCPEPVCPSSHLSASSGPDESSPRSCPSASVHSEQTISPLLRALPSPFPPSTEATSSPSRPFCPLSDRPDLTQPYLHDLQDAFPPEYGQALWGYCKKTGFSYLVMESRCSDSESCQRCGGC